MSTVYLTGLQIVPTFLSLKVGKFCEWGLLSTKNIVLKMKVLFNDLGYGTMGPYLSMPFLVAILNTVKLKNN